MSGEMSAVDVTNGVPPRSLVRFKGDRVNTDVLAESIKFPFSGRVAKNRFLKAPMTERLCHWPKDFSDITSRGIPSKELINLYTKWGTGDIGVIISGNIMIRYDAVEAFGNPILVDNHDNRVEQFKELIAATKAQGSLFIAQLSHPGRQGGVALNPRPVSASNVPLKIHWAGNDFAKPRALTIPEIKDLVRSYGDTAALCYEAGFDGVQIHCAHGYLLAQFLSKSTNLRTDEYGGSIENRSRIIFQIISEIRRRVPDPAFIICAKVNSVEFQPSGTTPDDCKFLCMKLEEARVDFVDLSGGTFEGRAFEHKKESTKAREAYFIEFAEMIRPHLKTTKVYVTGGFRTSKGMVSAVTSGSCDGIGIGRPLAAEPFFCKQILKGQVTGALENFVPLAQNTQASGTQMHQIGYGDRETSDWSNYEEVTRWLEALASDTARRKSVLPKVDSSGYPRIKAMRGFEYEAVPVK